MTSRPQRLSLSLPKMAVFTLPDAHEVDIECTSGAVWVTLDHDRRDIVLEPGQRFRSDIHRRALVAALEPSCVRFSAPGLSLAAQPQPAARSPWRLWPLLHGMSPA
ncbi:DUF2917 domain-containing protein [Variovorax sp. J22P168]|uniref:DUF2917 domain-containing protein n=1 Tax=Variovorax jilinensis TaxID=3053513 RepID=UPI002574B5B5|nr:DUF2917 domain-containing protein [Variovorax sp. J22P168]MDM0013988.1 DUF2917 domain-containing protein [Variovorax sp. J22P168]